MFRLVLAADYAAWPGVSTLGARPLPGTPLGEAVPARLSWRRGTAYQTRSMPRPRS
jgi:hypothetical protein